jgi:hypothetical protein
MQELNLNKSIFIYFIFTLLLSCHSKESHFEGTVDKSDAVADDIKIPKKIFENIVENIKNESATAEPVYLFFPLSVIFASTESSAIAKPVQSEFPNGGGRIDISTSVKGSGSFYFYFPPEQFEKLPELEHLYFMTEYPQKKIDNEIFGLGCGRWVDLKKQFPNFTNKNKVILNTTAQRYLYVAGGYYVFVFRKANQVYLSHLHVDDSRFNQLKCPDIIDTTIPKSEQTHEHK